MPGSLSYEDSSDDGLSVASSTLSGSTSSKGKRKVIKHPETKYYLAGPAPTMTQKQRLIHIRPRMVLQLQRLPASGKAGRPVPILEIKSSSSFVPRIAKKFPGLYKGTGQLGINDVMICKSENYSNPYDEAAEEEDTTCGTEAYDEKEVIAVICQAPKDSGYSGELCFDDGTRWVMKPGTGKKMLELTKTDPATGQTTIARWVPTGTSSRRSSFHTPLKKQTKGAADVAAKATDEKYTFSLIDPERRRHPVMATLKMTGLTVKDTYSPIDSTPASSSASLATPSPPAADAADLAKCEDGKSSYPLPSEPPIIKTTEDQKLLIEISAVWLASRLGWCPWSDALHPVSSSPIASGSSSASKPTTRQRSTTLGTNGSASSKHKRQRSGTVGSIAEDVEVGTTGGAGAVGGSGTGSLSRRSGNIFKRSSLNNGVFHPSDSEHSPPRSTRTSPKRSVSTGAAFMQRQAEKRVSRPPSESGSRAGSTTVSRNNSRPSSPRRACSVDLLTSMGSNLRHGEALTKGLAKYEEKRNSAPMSMVRGTGAVRRTQSDFVTSGGSGSTSPNEGPRLKIGEPVRPEIMPGPLPKLESPGPAHSATGRKNDWDGGEIPNRAATLPSKKSKPQRESMSPGSPGGAPAPKKKVGKMDRFIGWFNPKQRALNKEIKEGR